MNLKEIKTLSEISKETGISVRQLTRKLNKLIEEGDLKEFKHYRKLDGAKQPYILSKDGIEKITGGSK